MERLILNINSNRMAAAWLLKMHHYDIKESLIITLRQTPYGSVNSNTNTDNLTKL